MIESTWVHSEPLSNYTSIPSTSLPPTLDVSHPTLHTYCEVAKGYARLLRTFHVVDELDTNSCRGMYGGAFIRTTLFDMLSIPFCILI